MTRLMRVNKLLYEEVYQVLYTEYAVHIEATERSSVEDWAYWLRKHNPQAIQLIRHLDTSVSLYYASESSPRCGEIIADRGIFYRQGLAAIEFFPNVKTIRVMLYFDGEDDDGKIEEDPQAFQKFIVQHIMKWTEKCGGREVMLIHRPCWRRYVREIVQDCQHRLKQKVLEPLPSLKPYIGEVAADMTRPDKLEPCMGYY
jgi:hypothetical protein